MLLAYLMNLERVQRQPCLPASVIADDDPDVIKTHILLYGYGVQEGKQDGFILSVPGHEYL
jgi:hypothetical protein